ncbi:molybdopterin-dependent oxidoreductase [Aquihabitans sp. McL0605]|uniref:molybdopterin-dependent oxidoreductase n=1 Tax=Aquihabitans sp. McL0605 TaxID=3415671 RepID=UPI003CF69B88
MDPDTHPTRPEAGSPALSPSGDPSGDEATGPKRRPPRPSIWRTALAGLLAAALALAIGELIAGLSSQLTSPVISVGNRVIDAVPRQLKDFAIETFGTNDKKALLFGIYSFAAILGLVVGILAGRRFLLGAAGIALFGVVGVWAAGQEVGAPVWAGLPSIIGAVVGIAALALLLAVIPHADHPKAVDRLVHPVGRTGAAAGAGPTASPTDPPHGAFARRGFLKMSAAVVVVGVAATTGGRWLQGRFSAASSRLAVVLPKPKKAPAPVAAGVVLDLQGISSFITPNSDFYRIDTNLTVPQIAAETWKLKIKGMVDHDVEYTYDDILAMDMIEERITMTCVSNEVGGALVGTASWLGVPLKELLATAGIQKGADQIVGRAFDGFTTGFPVDTLDGRPAMLAVGMNGEPLPLAHGFPARIIVPGLYGFVSATKWLTEIELTTFADFDQYWVKRDWSDRGPIKTMSRIDTPRGLQNVKAGKAKIGGVAWAQTRGIDKVEIKLDDGPWTKATLAAADSKLTWRQWVYEFDATPGRHQVVCRATDATGATQTEDRAKPFPDGASGWHSVAFLVS